MHAQTESSCNLNSDGAEGIMATSYSMHYRPISLSTKITVIEAVEAGTS